MKARVRTVSTYDRLAGLGATLGLIVIVGGLPVALLAIGASPIPDQIPTLDEVQSFLTSPDDGTLFLKAIGFVAWLAWAFMAILVVVEVCSQLRGVRAPRMPALPGLRVSQSAARSLVATAALLFIAAPGILESGQLGTTQDNAAEPVQTMASAQTPTMHRVPTDRGSSNTWDAEQDLGERQQEHPRSTPHTVGPGETLWSIARTHLDDGARYAEIVELNRDLLGEDPGFLQVGWILQVPDAVSLDADAPKVDFKSGQRAVTVNPGDTLSRIAEAELDNPASYPQIFEASTAINQPGGAHLVDPDMIDVGWTLVIPAVESTTSVDPAPTKEQVRSDHDPKHSPEPDHAPTTQEHTPPVDPKQWPGADPTTGPLGERVPGGHEGDLGRQTNEPDAAREVGAEDDRGGIGAPWLLIGLTGGGAVLAAGLYRGLEARRRLQWRARRPGRAIVLPGPELAPVEKTIHAAGATAAPTVEFMDEALRRLAGQRSADGEPMPAVAAVELSKHHLVLHLADPATLDDPWEGTADSMHWRCGTDVNLDGLGPGFEELIDQAAPYPMLATIGSTDDGEVWLINCEELATLAITGDVTYGRDFARYLAAELAMNPWSAGIVVDCIGIAEEIAPMEGDRIHFHRPGPARDHVTSEVLADAIATVDRSQAAGSDVVTARSAHMGAEVWPARLLLIDAANTGDSDDSLANHGADNSTNQSPVLSELLHLADNHAGHTGTAVVLVGDETGTPGAALNMTSNGRVQLAAAGLDLVAVGLTADEAHGCAALLAQSEERADTEMPIDEPAQAGWEVYASSSGSLRPEYTEPRDSEPAADSHDPDKAPIPHAEKDRSGFETARGESLLPSPDEDYIAAGAATADDLAYLAPKVPIKVRHELEEADPTLDEELAAWFDPESTRPTLSLLGPVSATAYGKALRDRKAYYIELLTYLALRRRHGATGDEVAEAFNLQPPKNKPDQTSPRVKVIMTTLRSWLGTNPATGTKYLPNAPDAPATRLRGVNVYQLDDGLLVDADLFRRLRVRGQARGPAGIHDLRQALSLVSGRPFDQVRKASWTWLFEGERVDHALLCAIADTAHVVATHGFTSGDLELARYAVEKAMLAAPDEDTTQMNRAALAVAEGFPQEAERILREEVCNRSDDGHAPLDLTQRVDEILRNHNWLATG